MTIGQDNKKPAGFYLRRVSINVPIKTKQMAASAEQQDSPLPFVLLSLKERLPN
jgi:hypothetical protein